MRYFWEKELKITVLSRSLWIKIDPKKWNFELICSFCNTSQNLKRLFTERMEVKWFLLLFQKLKESITNLSSISLWALCVLWIECEVHYIEYSIDNCFIRAWECHKFSAKLFNRCIKWFIGWGNCCYDDGGRTKLHF